MNVGAAASGAWSIGQTGGAAMAREAEVLRPGSLGGPRSASVASTSAAHLQSPAASNIEFKNATRQEVFNWMNGEILAGRMTVDESTPFLGMTLKMSAATFRPVDMATDHERINFVQKAQLGIEWADAHGFRDQAAYLRHALGIMQRVEAQSPMLDVVV
jgi:hypothetical protein